MRHRLKTLWRQLRNENTTPKQLAGSVFVGLFLGILPVYGIQTLLVIGSAQLFRLNKLAAVAAAQVSLPPFAPFLVAAGIGLGEWMRFGTVQPLDLSQSQNLISGLALFSSEVPSLFLSCLLGDAVLGLVVATIGALVTYQVTSRWSWPPSEPDSADDDPDVAVP